MRRSFLLVMCGLLSLPGTSGPLALAAEPGRGAEERFEAEIRPVLVQTCFPCHGGKKTSGGLRVDTREALLKGGDRGAAIVPGDAEPEPAGPGPAARGRIAEDAARQAAAGADGRRLRPVGRGRSALGAEESRSGPGGGSSFTAKSLGLRAREGRRSARRSERMVGSPDRPVHRRRPPQAGSAAGGPGKPADAAPQGHLRPDRPAADSRGDGGLPER